MKQLLFILCVMRVITGIGQNIGFENNEIKINCLINPCESYKINVDISIVNVSNRDIYIKHPNSITIFFDTISENKRIIVENGSFYLSNPFYEIAPCLKIIRPNDTIQYTVTTNYHKLNIFSIQKFCFNFDYLATCNLDNKALKTIRKERSFHSLTVSLNEEVFTMPLYIYGKYNTCVVLFTNIIW